MAAVTSISFAFHGFAMEEEMILKSYFANADKWDPPWEFINQCENARVIVSNAATEQEFTLLIDTLPGAEIIVYSANKPENDFWHLARQANGKPSIVEFSKLVLKISRTLKKDKPKFSTLKNQQTTAPVELPSAVAPPAQAAPKPEPKTQTIQEAKQVEVEIEPLDMSSFFNQLDSIMETKPNEKRRRFNDKS